jgi:uncharacterized membrane protein YecN with MAPEG domain
MTVVPITTIYVAVSALVLVVISWQVIRRRRELGVAVGDAGDALLTRRIRAHANFVEYVPLALLLILSLELAQVAAAVLHTLGCLLVAGRLIHAWAIVADSVPGRVIGMGSTFLVLIAGAGTALFATVPAALR